MAQAYGTDIRHITLATDLAGRTDRAFDRAVDLARRWNARLSIVHAVEDRLPERGQPSLWRGADRVEAARRKLQYEYPQWQGVETSIEIEVGRPQDVVANAAMRARTDLIVTGIAREDVYGRDDVGAIVPELARKAVAPVLVVKKRLSSAPPRVIAATDLTDTSDAAVRLALELFGPDRVTLFNAFDIPYRGLVMGQPDELDRKLRPRVLAQARNLLVGLAGRDAAAQVEIVAKLGRPVPLLARLAAERNIDMVVTGTYGHGAVMNALLGSTAMEILAEVDCDVLIARRTPEPRSPRADVDLAAAAP